MNELFDLDGSTNSLQRFLDSLCLFLFQLTLYLLWCTFHKVFSLKNKGLRKGFMEEMKCVKKDCMNRRNSFNRSISTFQNQTCLN